MISVKSVEVLSCHEFFAVQGPTGQRMVVDDVSDEAPLVGEKPVVPLNERELLSGESGVIRLWDVRSCEQEAFTMKLLWLVLRSLLFLDVAQTIIDIFLVGFNMLL